MPPCAEKECPSLALRDGYCAVHLKFRQAKSFEELRCVKCRWKFRKGQWYEITDSGIQHPTTCPKEERDAKIA